jgi:hypothetical protein
MNTPSDDDLRRRCAQVLAEVRGPDPALVKQIKKATPHTLGRDDLADREPLRLKSFAASHRGGCPHGYTPADCPHCPEAA